MVNRSNDPGGAKPYPAPANTSLSALVSSEPPGRASGSPELRATPSGGRGPQASRLKLVAIGASVALSVVFGLSLRHRGGRSLEQNVHGSPGIKLSKSGAEVRWHKHPGKVLIDASVEKLGPDAVSAVQNAFGSWLGADSKLPELSFDTTRGARATLAPDGNNTVLVAPITVHGHEHDLAITLTYSDESTGAIVEADMIINSEQAFRVLNEDEGEARGDADGHQQRSSCASGGSGAERCKDGAYDVQNVVTHEVGHFFGLGEEMTDNGATMFYCTSRCETHKRALTRVDTDTISSLYVAGLEDGAASDTESQGGCGGARMVRRGNLGEAAFALSAALLLLVRRRRAR